MEKIIHNQPVVLCNDHVYFGGMQLTYRFSVLPSEVINCYLISVSLGDEICEVEVGNDLVRSLGYYCRIREGCVTPCGLEDVMQELNYA